MCSSTCKGASAVHVHCVTLVVSTICMLYSLCEGFLLLLCSFAFAVVHYSDACKQMLRILKRSNKQCLQQLASQRYCIDVVATLIHAAAVHAVTTVDNLPTTCDSLSYCRSSDFAVVPFHSMNYDRLLSDAAVCLDA
jgi:hypothetical protein